MTTLRWILLLCLSIASGMASAQNLQESMQAYTAGGKAPSYTQEQQLLVQTNPSNLVEIMQPYYTDSLYRVRLQAYYLSFAKLRTMTPADSMRHVLVNALLPALADQDARIVGQVVGYLKHLYLSDFDASAKAYLADRIEHTQAHYYRDVVLLAGFAGTGGMQLMEQYLNPYLPTGYKWYIRLALARMGNVEQQQYCLARVSQLPINNDMIESGLTQLIYTRSKEGILYAVQLLDGDKLWCYSLNPDHPAPLHCGYRVLELLAPVVVGIPVKVHPSGDLETDKPDELLTIVQQWFAQHPDFEINTERY